LEFNQKKAAELFQRAIERVNWPECNEWGVPKEKMPDCPFCGLDELGLIHDDEILCYYCGVKFYKEIEVRDEKET